MATPYQKFVQKIGARLPEKAKTIFLHPAGPTTIFFWAPTFKWGLVFAGIGDIHRPEDTISLSQTFSLMLTGTIWSRWSMIIVPKNYNLLCVNAFVAATGAYNFIRALKYQINKPEEATQKK